MSQPAPRFLAVTGPTASGKTDLSLALAERLAVEIISMDSRQVYRGLDVGTDKVRDDAREAVPHLGLDLVGPEERYSAGRFARDVRRWIPEIEARGRLPLVLDWRAARAELESFLRTTPFRLPLDATPMDLSAGEKQKLEILKQLFLKPRLLILDEPTSVLTPQEADEVLGALRGRAARRAWMRARAPGSRTSRSTTREPLGPGGVCPAELPESLPGEPETAAPEDEDAAERPAAAASPSYAQPHRRQRTASGSPASQPSCATAWASLCFTAAPACVPERTVAISPAWRGADAPDCARGRRSTAAACTRGSAGGPA